MGWWSSAARDLPWRETRDPWKILVSEVMAQQTQVTRVIPSWIRFVERFPTPTHTAAASAGDVVALWDGLGYNRRAVALYRCACEIVEWHDGRVPVDLPSLLRLSGVGPYTARAVMAFAFERDVGVVDTNVGRVLARVHGRRLAGLEVQEWADRIVPEGQGWNWNQAFLDFGAIVCSKRRPACADCPISDCCSFGGIGVDPAVGSAAVSRGQSRFAGSDRQGRGRLVAALRHAPVEVSELGQVVGWDSTLR